MAQLPQTILSNMSVNTRPWQQVLQVTPLFLGSAYPTYDLVLSNADMLRALHLPLHRPLYLSFCLGALCNPALAQNLPNVL